MNLKDALKNLKTIAPDPAYTARLRSTLIDTPSRRFTLREIVRENIELGAAIALTGLLVVVGLGAWNLKSPNGLRSLDVNSLKAEADAISNVQVELEHLQYTYEEATTTSLSPSIPKKKKSPVTANPETQSSTEEAITSPADALDALLE